MALRRSARPRVAGKGKFCGAVGVGIDVDEGGGNGVVGVDADSRQQLFIGERRRIGVDAVKVAIGG